MSAVVLAVLGIVGTMVLAIVAFSQSDTVGYIDGTMAVVGLSALIYIMFRLVRTVRALRRTDHVRTARR